MGARLFRKSGRFRPREALRKCLCREKRGEGAAVSSTDAHPQAPVPDFPLEPPDEPAGYGSAARKSSAFDSPSASETDTAIPRILRRTLGCRISAGWTVRTAATK